MLQRVLEIEHAGDLVHRLLDLGRAQAAIAQRKGQIVVDGHGVVDDRELEHLRDVALVGRNVRQVDAIEQNPSLGRTHETGDDVEQGGLAAAGRSEQGIGTAVRPLEVSCFSAQSSGARGFGR